MLYSAVTTGNASYDPMGACQPVFQDSRDDTNWYDFMLPEICVFTRGSEHGGQKVCGNGIAECLGSNNAGKHTSCTASC